MESLFVTQPFINRCKNTVELFTVYGRKEISLSIEREINMLKERFAFNRRIKILEEIKSLDEYVVLFLDTLEIQIVNKHYIKDKIIDEFSLSIKYVKE